MRNGDEIDRSAARFRQDLVESLRVLLPKEKRPVEFTDLYVEKHGCLGWVTGRITFTPVLGQVGPHTVELKVDDGLGGFSTQTWSLNVTAVTANRAPAITSRPVLVATQGEPYSYNVSL